MKSLKLTICFVALLLAAGGVFPARATGELVTGTNPHLPGVFIPLKPATSGTLGDLVGGVGPKLVGKSSDSLSLSAFPGSSTGYVDLMMNFDLSAVLTGPLTMLGGTLNMTFDDLDFMVISGPRDDFREMIELQVYIDGSPAGTPLFVDKDNYWSPDYNATIGGTPVAGSPFVTNNKEVTYEFDLGAPNPAGLGLLPADFAAISALKELDLKVTLFCETVHTTTATTSFRNSVENVEGVLDVVAVPEPAAASMLAIGALMFAARKRRN